MRMLKLMFCICGSQTLRFNVPPLQQIFCKIPHTTKKKKEIRDNMRTLKKNQYNALAIIRERNKEQYRIKESISIYKYQGCLVWKTNPYVSKPPLWASPLHLPG